MIQYKSIASRSKDAAIKAWHQVRVSKLLKYFLGTLGSAFVLISVGKNYFNLSILNSTLLGLSALVGIIIILFFRYFLRNLVRRNLYGEYLSVLKDITAEINTMDNLQPISDKMFTDTMGHVCDNIKSLFDLKIKEPKCSVSIKVAVGGAALTSETEVTNLCRDSITTQKKKRDTKEYVAKKHLIFQNTCFNVIVSNWMDSKIDNLYYINSDIPKSRPHYQNSSYGCYGENGQLDYQSEIVVPIIPLTDKNSHKIPTPLGFLCVDCEKKNAFDNQYDLILLQCIANNIYDIMILKESLNN